MSLDAWKNSVNITYKIVYSSFLRKVKYFRKMSGENYDRSTAKL